MTEQLSPIDQAMNWVKTVLRQIVAMYHPDTLRQQGAPKNFTLLISTIFILIGVLWFWWNCEPDLFDVQAIAQQRTKENEERLVVGYVTTNTLIAVTHTLLNKSGGYLSNDLLPPSVFMDDMPHWEFGVLQQIRDFSKALRNDLSRSRTQSSEDPDLANADPKFNTDNQSWFWPTAENEYQKWIDLVATPLPRWAAPN